MTNLSRPISAEGWSLGVKTDGTLWIWGYNQFGNLGQNNKTNYSSPVQVPGGWNSTITMGGNKLGTVVIGNV